MKSHLENPFRILGVNANISRKTLRELQQSLRTRLKIKQKITVKDPLAFLGDLTVTEIAIRDANTTLDKPNQRLQARLFWFTNTNNTDEKALSFLLSNELELAIDQWQMDNQINSKINLARVYLFLIATDFNKTIKYWEKALALWQEVLASKDFWIIFNDWETTSGFEPPATNLDLKEFRTQALPLVLVPFQYQLIQAIASENTHIAEQLLKLLTTSNLPRNLIKKLEKTIFEGILTNTSRTLDNLLNSLNKSLSKEGQLLESKRKACDQAYQTYKAELLPKLNYIAQLLDLESDILKNLKEKLADCLRKIANSYLIEAESYSNYEKLLKEALDLVPKTILAERIKQDLAQVNDRRTKHYLETGNKHYNAERYQEALSAYREAIQIDPTSSTAYFHLGLAYRKLARYQEAIDAFKNAITYDPDNSEAQFNLAFLHTKLAKFSLALPFYQTTIQLQPNYPEAYFYLGITYYELGQFEEAIVSYQQAISFTNVYPEAHYQLAVTLTKQSKHKEAIAAYQEVLRLNPENSKASYNLGLSYFQLGEYTLAINAFLQTIRHKANYAEAFYQLGQVYEKLSDYEQAITAYQKAICFKPSDVEAHFCLAKLYLKIAKYNEAINIYKQVIILSPKHWQAYFQMGLCYWHLNNLSLALTAYHQALEHQPNYEEAYFQIGLIYEKQARFQEAIDSYKQALQVNVNYLVAQEALESISKIETNYNDHSKLSNISYDPSVLNFPELFQTALEQTQTENYQEAIKIYKQIILHQANNIKAHNNLAEIYNKLGRYQEAIYVYQTLTQLLPKEAKNFYNLGVAYSKAGQFSEAIIAYHRSISLDNHQIDSHFALGVVYSKTNQLKEAIGAYKQVLNLAPEHANAYYNLGIVYRKLSKFLEALDNFKQALRYKQTAATHYNLGLVYEKLNRQQYAKQEYQKALKLDPSYQQAKDNLKAIEQGLISQQKVFESSFPVVNIVSSSNTKNNQQTNSLNTNKVIKNTLENYQEIANNNLNDAMAQYNLGIAYSKANLYQESIKSLQQAILLKNDFAAAYFALGVVYSKIALYQEAIGAYKLAIANNPKDMNSFYNLATIYRKSERYNEAIAAFQKTIEFSPENAKARYGLGLTYVLIKDWHAALAEYESLKNLDTNLADELFNQIGK